ncbi:hypothetical protein RHSIM_Rhsim06G0208400 [Rhododendron simsii]|uniref:Tubby-like F-box protein n=1 Tax=Rhododendron simsii TaxID=118357 RepID=A0A834LKC3_RHOSS|nr:hypothetical protein RHSIM_Rhsim06G0208400 [Rhododendron simsii]
MSATRRSYLSRRISSRSFLSKSFKESRTRETESKPDGDGKEDGAVSGETGGGSSWSTMLPELLGEIIQRVEASEDRWPVRQNVVACACVCKRWREMTREIVRGLPQSGKITFPSSLKQVGGCCGMIRKAAVQKLERYQLASSLPWKRIEHAVCLRLGLELQSVSEIGSFLSQVSEEMEEATIQGGVGHGGQPGPRESPLQCLIRRDKKNSTFSLYLGLTPTFMDKGKFLLAARRCRHNAHTEYIISLDADDFSQGSNAYVGKLSSDFLGTKFTIYDSQPPHSGAKPSSSRSGRRFASKQISPQVPAGNFEVGQVSYKFNLLKSRGPRRMICSLKCPWSAETQPDKPQDDSGTKSPKSSPYEYTILRNKAPRWHDHLQCWCLNFHGRVTVASVKNFQLVATLDQSQPGGKGDEETVLLQFGKVGDDTFTMDFRQPLSAFQAFAICLTSFGTKLACE